MVSPSPWNFRYLLKNDIFAEILVQTTLRACRFSEIHGFFFTSRILPGKKNDEFRKYGPFLVFLDNFSPSDDFLPHTNTVFEVLRNSGLHKKKRDLKNEKLMQKSVSRSNSDASRVVRRFCEGVFYSPTRSYSYVCTDPKKTQKNRKNMTFHSFCLIQCHRIL